MQSVIVLCRYGHLKDFSLPLNSIYTVSQRTALPYTTVKRVLDKFKANNYKFTVQEKRGSKPFKNIPKELQEELASRRLQEEWKGYPLRKRALLVKQLYDVKISYSTLRKFYRAHDIKYRKTQIVYRNSLKNRDQRDEERREFAELLAQIMYKKHPIIYCDETSFAAEACRVEKTWSSADDPIEVQINNNPQYVTIYGAISSDCLNNAVFMEGSSTNTTEFKKFLEKVLLEVKCEYRGSKRAVLIMDNHGAHISKKNRPFLEREFFPVFLPAHSSPFNSIERVWSAAKHNFALLSLHNHEEMKR